MLEIFSTKEIKDFIVELNKGQLSKGIDGNNSPIEGRNIGLQGEYSPTTKQIRSEAGLQIQVIDLNFTGEFYSTIRVIVGKTFFDILANPIKDNTDLYIEFGEDINKLTKESEVLLCKKIADEIKIRILQFN